MWQRDKVQADALLRVWDLSLLTQLHHMLAHWVDLSTPAGPARDALGLSLLVWLHEHCGARVDPVACILHRALECWAGLGPETSLQHKLAVFHAAATAEGVGCTCAASFPADRVLVPLLFGGRAVLTEPHAAAVRTLILQEDDVGAAKLHAVYGQSDANKKQSGSAMFLQGGLPRRLLAHHIAQGFEHAPAQLYRAALALRCMGPAVFGGKEPAAPSAGPIHPAPPRGLVPIAGSSLALRYARALDARMEQACMHRGTTHFAPPAV